MTPSQHITLKTAKQETFSGYLSRFGQTKSPGIVLIQEIFGVNASIRSAADRFAEAGYVVLAPDLFWRFKPNLDLSYDEKDMEEAFGYYHRFDVDQGVSDMAQAVETLRQHPSCNGKVAVMGFCLGGKLAYLTAARHTVDAAVPFYGGGIAEHLNEAKNIHCPMLMHFGKDDEMIPQDQVDAIREAFAGRVDVEIKVYAGANHAFYNEFRPNYNKEAAKVAHQKTLDFLKRVLG